MNFDTAISAATASGMAKIIVAPIDCVKVNIQTNGGKILPTINKIYSKSILGFYKGIYVNISRTYLMYFSRFLVLEDFTKKYGIVCGGMLTSTLQVAIVHPVEYFRQKIIIDNSKLRDISIRNVYRGGLFSTLIGLIVTFEYAIYLKLKEINPFFAGSAAMMASHSIIFPLDSAMRKHISGRPMKDFYRGFYINLIRVAPCGGLTYFFFENIKKIREI